MTGEDAMPLRRLFALIPAAGHSRRMGEPKLLLTIAGESLIRRLVRQLDRSEIASILVLIRADDRPLMDELRRTAADVIVSRETPDMKASVRKLIESLSAHHRPAPGDGWLLIPADHPIVEEPVLMRLLEQWDAHPDAIVVPVHQGRRGHPVILPWRLTDELSTIPADQGLNWLIRRAACPTIEVDCPEPSVLWDVDTPEEFQRIKVRLEGQELPQQYAPPERRL